MRGDRIAHTMLFASLSLFAMRANARPLMDPTPTPSPTETPVATAAPIATATPVDTAAPVATPAMAPSASPSDAAVTPTPTPAPSQEPAAEPVFTPPPPPAPVDFTAGMPGSMPGSRRLRAAFVLGFHVFAGEGWDKKAGPPPNAEPLRGADYLGGVIQGAAIYDLTPIVAIVGTIGGHNGTHGTDTGVGTPRTTVSFNTWYGDGALRLQTPANVWGLWIEGGAGAYAARRQVEIKTNLSDKISSKARAGVSANVSTGLQYHLAQGLDIFGEVRWLYAPGRFGSEDSLDAGGFATLAGASLRL